MVSLICEIAVTALVSALFLASGHYFNWRGVIGRPLGPIPAYVYGTASIILPVAVFCLWRGGLDDAVIALLSVTLAAGGTVVICYAIDSWIDAHARAIDAEERERKLLEKDQDERSA